MTRRTRRKKSRKRRKRKGEEEKQKRRRRKTMRKRRKRRRTMRKRRNYLNRLSDLWVEVELSLSALNPSWRKTKQMSPRFLQLLLLVPLQMPMVPRSRESTQRRKALG